MRVTEIRIYPVKSMRGVAVERAVVEPQGLAGDRRFMVVDEEGIFLSQREAPGLATFTAMLIDGGVRITHATGPGDRGSVDVAPDLAAPPLKVRVWHDFVPAQPAPAADALVSEVLGRPSRIVYLADPAARSASPDYAEPGSVVSFADGFPLLATTQASLAGLNGKLHNPVPMERFRPNLVLDGTSAWDEDGWRKVTVGDVRFSAVKPCGRCIVTTRDQATGVQPDGNEPLATLYGFRRGPHGATFGVNLVSDSRGTIAVGEAVSADCASARTAARPDQARD